MEHIVYLAGPMSGFTFQEANGWREYVASRLSKNIHAVSPIRGAHKREEKSGGVLSPTDQDPVFGTDQAITTRDRNDVIRSSVVFFNFLKPSELRRFFAVKELEKLKEHVTLSEFEKVKGVLESKNYGEANDYKKASIGTCIELGWADMARKVCIVVMGKNNVHDYPMVRAIASYPVVDNLDTAIDIVNSVLSEGGEPSRKGADPVLEVKKPEMETVPLPNKKTSKVRPLNSAEAANLAEHSRN